jgi:hypothetical protein
MFFIPSYLSSSSATLNRTPCYETSSTHWLSSTLAGMERTVGGVEERCRDSEVRGNRSYKIFANFTVQRLKSESSSRFVTRDLTRELSLARDSQLISFTLVGLNRAAHAVARERKQTEAPTPAKGGHQTIIHSLLLEENIGYEYSLESAE